MKKEDKIRMIMAAFAIEYAKRLYLDRIVL